MATIYYGDVNMSDNVALKFGAGNDLSISHLTGPVFFGNFISSADTVRDLTFLSTVGFQFKTNVILGETLANFNANGSVDLYYDNSKKFETTSGGATITGALSITGDGSNATTLTESSIGIFTIAAVDDIILDAAGDIALDAGGDDIRLRVNGTTYGSFNNASSDLNILSTIQDKSIKFSGDDGGSAITALTLDMSNGGSATFRDDVFALGQFYTKGADLVSFTVASDLDTGLGNWDGSGQVGLVSNNKAVITAKDDKIAFDAYDATAVATTGSLNPNQSQQALTSDTLAVLAVDPSGNIVRGSQEGTWTFTKAQLDALTTSTTSGTTLIKSPGTNKAIIVEESNLMLKYSGTGSMSTNSFVIRQGNNGDAAAEITRLPSGQINTIMSSAPTNPTYGFYSRDLPLYNGDGRSFVCNKATFLTRITANATPTNLISISIKLKYRIFNASTF